MYSKKTRLNKMIMIIIIKQVTEKTFTSKWKKDV